MRRAPQLTSCCVALILASGLILSSCGPGGQKSADTARIIDGIDEFRGRKTPADMNAATRLNQEGDRAYKKSDYYEAFKAYDNSYPNYPNAYAYIMAGDSFWRGFVQLSSNAVQDDRHCRLSNDDFPRRLDQNISQNYEVGIALAVKDGDTSLMKSNLYKRAVQSDKCLRQIYELYKTQAADVCVDINKIQVCLEQPLL